jgi:hypothetical protein
MPGPCSEKSASPREGRGHCAAGLGRGHCAAGFRLRRSAAPQVFRRGEHMGRVGFDPRTFFPGMAGHPCLILRAPSLSLQGEPANIGKGLSEPARFTRGSGDQFGIPKPRESGSVIGADRSRSGPSCVLPKGVPQGQTESGGVVLAVICWAPSAQRRCYPTGRCTYRP